MTAPVPVTPGPDSYTLQDWTQILHNAAQVKNDHPRYGEARAVIHEALQRIGGMHAQQNQADLAALQPNALESGIVGFGQGASLGLADKLGNLLPGASNSDFVSQARTAHPLATGAGDLLGTGALGAIAAPLVAGLSPAAGGAVLGGGLGAARGGVEGGAPGAVAGGLLGAAAGGVGGKVVGAIGKVGGQVIKNAKGLLGGAPADEELIGNMSAGAIRRQLTKQGFSSENIEKTITAAKAQVSQAPATAEATKPQVPGTMGPIAGTGGRGFEVTGERATPPVPTVPTITEIQDRLAGLGKGKTVPYYTRGGKVEQGMPPAPQASSKPDPASFSPQLEGWRASLNNLEQQIGREVTPQEREAVFEARRLATEPQAVSPQSQEAAARSAYHLATEAGQDPIMAARRAAGTYSTFDPRQALALALLLGATKKK